MEILERYAAKTIGVLLVIQGVALVVLIGIEVLFRYGIGSALSWPEEVAGIVFVWFTLLGVALVTQEDSHIAFDFLPKRLPPGLSRIVRILSHLIVAVYGLIMAYFGYTYARMFSFETTPAANINLIWLNASLPVSGLLIFFYAQLKILHLLGFRGKRRKP